MLRGNWSVQLFSVDTSFLNHFLGRSTRSLEILLLLQQVVVLRYASAEIEEVLSISEK